MADLTVKEQEMFGKYWGQENLAFNEHFWEDASASYCDGFTNIMMPLVHCPESVRRVLDILECPPGKCGKCCCYSVIQVNDFDIRRIIDNTDYTQKDMDELVKVKEDGNKFLDGTNGCPFLKDDTCLVYKYRPDTCYLFPIQGPRQAFINDKPIQQMLIRAKCPESMKVIRNILTDAVVTNKMMLLPDLSLIPPKTQESKKSKKS